MKKLITTLFSLAIIMSMTILTSCSSAPSDADVSSVLTKYQSGSELTKADYDILLNYAEAAIDEMAPLAKKAENAESMEEIADIIKKGEKIEKKYKYMDNVVDILDNADDADLGSKGEALVKKLEDLY